MIVPERLLITATQRRLRTIVRDIGSIIDEVSRNIENTDLFNGGVVLLQGC